ncbi:hypothetical protein ACHAW6_000400 [Cyclotella cf. meneghiniana]
MCSSPATPPPFEDVHSKQLCGRIVQDIYTKTYHVWDTIFTDQMGQFSLCSQTGNKYIMVMVEINSSAILVKPVKNCTDAELTRTYSALMLCLRWASITPCKHILDNEISTALKDLIQDTYKLTLELAPQAAITATSLRSPSVTSNHTSSAYLQRYRMISLSNCGTNSFYKRKFPSTFSDNPMQHLWSLPMLISIASVTITKCR